MCSRERAARKPLPLLRPPAREPAHCVGDPPTRASFGVSVRAHARAAVRGDAWGGRARTLTWPPSSQRPKSPSAVARGRGGGAGRGVSGSRGLARTTGIQSCAPPGAARSRFSKLGGPQSARPSRGNKHRPLLARDPALGPRSACGRRPPGGAECSLSGLGNWRPLRVVGVQLPNRLCRACTSLDFSSHEVLGWSTEIREMKHSL